MTNRPNSIKVGGLLYTVEWRDGSWCAGTSHWGECNFVEQVIRINGDMLPDHIASTFLHEVTHAVLSHFGECDTKNDDESICTIIGNGLSMVWRDNPKVFDWWQTLLC
jgi:hypothetical protein